MQGGNITREPLIASWQQEERQPFSGWDFSYIDARMVEEERPWSFPERATALMQRSSSMLDMGTGGGERLLELQQSWLAFEDRSYLIEAQK